jgi:hypothetical protein
MFRTWPAVRVMTGCHVHDRLSGSWRSRGSNGQTSLRANAGNRITFAGSPRSVMPRDDSAMIRTVCSKRTRCRTSPPDSTELNRSWEANSRVLTEEVPCFLWKQEIGYREISGYCRDEYEHKDDGLDHRPDDGCSTHLWNVGVLKRDYTELSCSYSPPWEPEISQSMNITVS